MANQPHEIVLNGINIHSNLHITPQTKMHRYYTSTEKSGQCPLWHLNERYSREFCLRHINISVPVSKAFQGHARLWSHAGLLEPNYIEWGNTDFVYIWHLHWRKPTITKQTLRQHNYSCQWLNSLRPSDAIWQHRSGSTLAQVMACCLTAPSHNPNQCWLIISKVQLH